MEGVEEGAKMGKSARWDGVQCSTGTDIRCIHPLRAPVLLPPLFTQLQTIVGVNGQRFRGTASCRSFPTFISLRLAFFAFRFPGFDFTLFSRFRPVIFLDAVQPASQPATNAADSSLVNRASSPTRNNDTVRDINNLYKQDQQ